MNKYFILSLLLFAKFAIAQDGLQDTTKLNEIVIAENRLVTPFGKLARNVQVITKEQIAALPVKSINEVLTYVAGVDVRQRGPFGTQADVSIDGGSFEQTLILLNGVKISDVQTAHHSMNIPVPLSAIERIEVLKGPAARIYGVNALTGAINIVTSISKVSALNVNVQGDTSFEDKDVREGKGKYGGAGLNVSLNLAGKEHQHLFALGSNNYNGQRYNTSMHDDRLFYQGNLTLAAKHSLNAMAGYITNAFGANGFYAAPGDVESAEEVKTALVSLGSNHQFGEHFTLKPRVSARYNWDDYRYFRNNINRARSVHETSVLSAEINSVLNTNIGDFGFGLETRSEEIESTNIGNRDRQNHGFYAEYKNYLFNALSANVGTYANYNTQYGWQFFPGIDVAYTFTKQFKVAFNLGSSQRIPSFTDLYLNQRPGNIGNPDLASENAWQYEGSLQYQHENLTIQTGYFYRTITDFIDWIRDSSAVPYQPHNFGSNKVKGFNFGVNQTIDFEKGKTIYYQLSYNYLFAAHTGYTNHMISKYALAHLKHQALGRLVFNFKPVSFTVASRWIERVNNADYLISDLRLGYGKANYNLYVEASNVFNESYAEIETVPMPKRWFAIGANIKMKL